MAEQIAPANPTRPGLRLRRVALAAGVLAIALLAQATWLPRLRFFDAAPNLVLVVVVTWSLLKGVEEGLAWAFVAGMIFDLIAGLPLGASSLAFMAVCFLSGLGKGPFFARHLFLPMTIIAIATPIYAWIVLLAERVGGMAVDWGGMTLRVIVPELLLNVILVTVIFPTLRWLVRRTGAGRLEW